MSCAKVTIAGSRPRFQFRRDRLPDPVTYYTKNGYLMRGYGDWRSTLCPFHKDTRPSMRVNIHKGAFCCMVCGAKGGDVLAFHMKTNGLNFKDAAKDLGAWDEVTP